MSAIGGKADIVWGNADNDQVQVTRRDL